MHSCIIIGAGAAGLSAANALRDAGITPLIVEARDRIGGRIFTDHTYGAAELGAEFIHGEYASTWKFVRAAGLRTSDWRGQRRFALGGELLPLDTPIAGQVERLYDAATHYHGDPCSAADFLASARSDPAHPLATRWLANIEGADPLRLDVAALSRERATSSNGETNFHILDGYDQVVQHMAVGLEIRRNWPVREIIWGDAGVTLRSDAGAELQAHQVIITIPLGVLQAERVRFEPPLPPAKQQAIGQIAMGHVTKLVLWFDQSIWPEEIGLISSDGIISTWWPVESAAIPTLMGYTGGLFGLEVANLGEEAAIAVGLRELSALLGRDVAAHSAGGRLSDWSRDPWSLGAYTYSPLGMGDARSVLAAAVGPLHFAGEATVLNGHIATVHGAIESGRRAAAEIVG